jgi:hypothetical protein
MLVVFYCIHNKLLQIARLMKEFEETLVSVGWTGDDNEI